jgi:hypothetical protein
MSTDKPDTTPKRLRAGEIIDAQHEALMAALTRTSGQGATVEIARNAKGDYQFSVKVSDDDPNKAQATAVLIATVLETRYPYGVPPEATA